MRVLLKHFFAVCGLSFDFLNSIFQKLLLYIKSNLWIFSYCSTYWVPAKKSLPNSRSYSFSCFLLEVLKLYVNDPLWVQLFLSSNLILCGGTLWAWVWCSFPNQSIWLEPGTLSDLPSLITCLLWFNQQCPERQGKIWLPPRPMC